jgi:hypothetical protein
MVNEKHKMRIGKELRHDDSRMNRLANVGHQTPNRPEVCSRRQSAA